MNDNVIYDRRKFIEKHFNGDLIPFTNRGYMSWIVFKDHAMVVLKDAKGRDNDDPIEGVGHIIAKECKEINLVKGTYTTYIDLEQCMNQVSPSLKRLLEDVSPVFSNSLFTALIGSIVTSIVQNEPTQLQLSLGICFDIPKPF